MNLVDLNEKLMAAARANPPGDAVPFGFEQRVMARLRARALPDLSSLWSAALWWAAAPCTAIMLLLSAWAWTNQPPPSSSSDLSQEFDSIVLAAADSEQTYDSSW